MKAVSVWVFVFASSVCSYCFTFPSIHKNTCLHLFAPLYTECALETCTGSSSLSAFTEWYHWSFSAFTKWYHFIILCLHLMMPLHSLPSPNDATSLSAFTEWCHFILCLWCHFTLCPHFIPCDHFMMLLEIQLDVHLPTGKEQWCGVIIIKKVGGSFSVIFFFFLNIRLFIYLINVKKL